MIKWFYSKAFNAVDWLFFIATLGLYAIILYVFNMPTWAEQWQENRTGHAPVVGPKGAISDAPVDLQAENECCDHASDAEQLVDNAELLPDTGEDDHHMAIGSEAAPQACGASVGLITENQGSDDVSDMVSEAASDTEDDDPTANDSLDGQINDPAAIQSAIDWMRQIKKFVLPEDNKAFFAYKCDLECYQAGMRTYHEDEKQAVKDGALTWVRLCQQELNCLGISHGVIPVDSSMVGFCLRIVFVYTALAGDDPDFPNSANFHELCQKYDGVKSSYALVHCAQGSSSVVTDYQRQVDDFLSYTGTLLQTQASGGLVNSVSAPASFSNGLKSAKAQGKQPMMTCHAGNNDALSVRHGLHAATQRPCTAALRIG